MTTNIITLTSNIETLKERNLQSKDSELSVAVLLSDLEKGVSNPTLYAYRYGMIYNPTDFKPNIEGNHKLKTELIEEYFKMLDKAREELERIKPHYNQKGPNLKGAIEIDELKKELFQMNCELIEKNTIIEELRKNPIPAIQPNDQIAQLENMIKIMSNAMPQTITVKIGEKTNQIKKQVLHEEFETVLAYIAENEPVYLHGPAGTGKSHIAEQIAQALNLDFYPTQALSQEFKLTGFIDAHGNYQETQFYKAFKHGGLFMIDEIDASHPDVLVQINTALANGRFDFPNEKVEAHEDFRIITAGNTTGQGADMQYTGRYQLDASTLDRFFMVEINYSPAIENEIAQGKTDLLEFARTIRQTATDNGINLLFSYRSLGRIAKMESKMELPKLLEQALLKGMAKDDIKMLSRNMVLDNDNKYFKALKKAC